MDVVKTLPNRAMTYADLASMPDDGHRYELLDGTLLVSPSPSPVHQEIVVNLARLLAEAQPSGVQTYVAPLDVVFADDTVLQPDVLVARRSDVGRAAVTGAPVLAVEVISPSSRRIDRLLKFSRYAAAGVAHYWIMDPDTLTLAAYALRDGEQYVEVAVVRGPEAYAASAPFPVTVTPAGLVESS